MFFLKPNVAKLKEKKDVGGLIKALSHKDVSIRVEAANALAEVGDSSAVEALIKALSDSSIDVRKAAVRALANVADERAVASLVKVLKEDDSIDVRVEAAKALVEVGQMKAGEVVESISGMLNIPKDVVTKMLSEKKLIDAAKDKFLRFLK